jgi:hypothetical protein
MHPFYKEISDDIRVSLPSRPQDRAVTLRVDQTEVSSLLVETLKDLQSAKAGRDVNGALSVMVRLVDVDGGQGEQPLKAFEVVLFNGAEDGGEDKVPFLKEHL